MTKYQRYLYTRIGNLQNELASDYDNRCLGIAHMSASERKAKESQINKLSDKLKLSYQ